MKASMKMIKVSMGMIKASMIMKMKVLTGLKAVLVMAVIKMVAVAVVVRASGIESTPQIAATASKATR